MKTNKELEKMSITDLEDESRKYYEYVSKIDKLIKYKEAFKNE